MSREAPVPGEDYEGLGCGNPNCPCQRPGCPCEEFMGYDGEEWCPRCGWHFKHHPDAARRTG